MRPLRALLLANVLILPSALLLAATTTQTATSTPVLVELFTSEGCSSCPPADDLLNKLSRLQPVPGANIIVLSEHVDYWDHQGWRDPYSSVLLTVRQQQYGVAFHVPDVYTPQIVIDGTRQFVGTDVQHILDAIQHQTPTAKLVLSLSKPTITGSHVAATVSSATLPPKLRGDLYAALVDPSDTTDVHGGENKGHSLTFVNVVRTFQHIGTLKDLRSGARAFTLDVPKNANPASMHLVVFAQTKDSGPIQGIAAAAITP